MSDDSGSVFPGPFKVGPGLTKRELFAALIIQGYYSSSRPLSFATPPDRCALASLACQQADALLAELDNTADWPQAAKDSKIV